MDLLQELIAINTEFRRAGRAREGRFIAFTHAKGGVGCTSVVAALGEVCSIYNKRTLLWDLDVETRDLSRALNVSGPEAQVLSAWVNGSREVSRDSLEEALVPISQEVSVLMPPDRMAECMDLVCHTDGIAIVERLVETARVLFDVVLADTGGRMGPAVGALLRAADLVIIVIDDSLLGLTAVDLYLRYVRTLLGGSDRVLFLVNPFSGADISVSEIASQLSAAGNFSENSWRLPALPNDPRAAIWPGSGSTLYGNGGKLTRAVLERIARELQIIDGTAKAATAAEGPRGVEERRSNPLLADPNNVIRTKSGNWIQKLIKKR
jgi:MinD-like ATPase involved in chromosome partitioning or flagellar assembly